MSDISPSPAAPAADVLPQAAAEEVIRRSIEMGERISLADLKASLAGLGIAPETVERAALEVLYELEQSASVDTPGKLASSVFVLVLVGIPAVGLIRWALGHTGFFAWSALIVGALLMFLVVTTILDEVATWLRVRQLRSGG